MKREDYILKILQILVTSKGYATTNQICNRCGCDRKTVYMAMDRLETSGFGIEVLKCRENKYKYVGTFGF